jgi:hypothetical protein
LLFDLRHPDADGPLGHADDDLIPGDTQVSVSAPKSVKIFLRSIMKVLVTESFAHWPLGLRLQARAIGYARGTGSSFAMQINYADRQFSPGASVDLFPFPTE